MNCRIVRGSSLLATSMLAAFGCYSTEGPGPLGRDFSLSDLAKTDTDSTLELFIGEQRQLMMKLTRKLYLRNPRELHKAPGMTIERRTEQLFTENFTPADIEPLSGLGRLRKSLEPGYAGDRVLAFVCGLRSMIEDSFDGKHEFYIPDQLDPQKLYNCARNLEIAAWKLTHDRGGDGEVLLLTNSMEPDQPMNLSYERLFGQLIALQDLSAKIVAERSNRGIRYVIQTMVFLPI